MNYGRKILNSKASDSNKAAKTLKMQNKKELNFNHKTL